MKVRSVFISDLHLGTRACKSRFLREFLHHVETENLFLVGDVIDLQRLSSRWHWTPEHSELVRCLVTLSRQGTRVLYIPGNHDDAFRLYAGTRFGEIRIVLNHVHRLADGRRLLLIHGDEFDFVVRHRKLLGMLGAVMYAQLVGLNRIINAARRRLGLEYWSLAGYVKRRNSNVAAMVENFKRAVCQYARSAGCDGVVAGHIHTAAIDTWQEIAYCNPGDWVESCTAVFEDYQGNLELVDWPDWSRQMDSFSLPEPAETFGWAASTLLPERA